MATPAPIEHILLICQFVGPSFGDEGFQSCLSRGSRGFGANPQRCGALGLGFRVMYYTWI